MNFRNLIDENLIILDSECKTKIEVIEKLVDLLDASGVLENRDEFLKVVMERETKSPTGLEDGLAIPHGKSTTVKNAKISAITAPKSRLPFLIPLSNNESIIASWISKF